MTIKPWMFIIPVLMAVIGAIAETAQSGPDAIQECVIGDVMRYDGTNMVPASVFVNRGDPTDWDFGTSNLTTDATWRDMDLTGIAGTNAKAVLLQVVVNDNTIGSTVRFRRNGNTNAIAISQAIVHDVNTDSSADLIVPLDAAGIIEYNADDVSFIDLNVVVKGWFY